MKILEVRLDNISKEEALKKTSEIIKSRQKGQIVTTNVEMIVLAQKDRDLREIINNSFISLPDSIGIKFASYLTSPIKNRVSGVKFFKFLCKLSEEENFKIFLLGGRDGVADKTATALRQAYPKLKISGTFEGSPNVKDEEKIRKKINSSASQILAVAYGVPAQEKWIFHNLEKLNINIALGVGGTFDYLAGRVKYAPAPVRFLGFEWLYRLIRQPWRIRRQVAIPVFVYWVLKEKFSHLLTKKR